MEKTDQNKQGNQNILVVLAMLIGIVVGVMSAHWFEPDRYRLTAQGDNLAENMATLVSVIENTYVDSVSMDSLTVLAYNALLTSLDPHSAFIPATQYAPRAEEMRGNFDGVGMALIQKGDTIFAGEVYEGSPAATGGILPGDWIVKVDTVQVPGGATLDSVVRLIRGPKHSRVSITVRRWGKQPGGEQELTFSLVRNVIARHTVTSAIMLDKQRGFIRIESFSQTTSDEFRDALKKLKGMGMKSLVLDLRGNEGGLLMEAVAVADELLPKNAMMVYTEGRHERRREYHATGRGLFTEGDLTVLIDENSASASEIVAGAVQDNDRGEIAGRRSFGKGLVQSTIQTLDGSMLILTTARYYTPSGRCIQRDYRQGTEDYYAEHMLRLLLDDESVATKRNAVDSSQAYLTKNGRTVYGGGGIVPDKILPYLYDTHYVFYNQLVKNRVLSDYAIEYLHLHYADLIRRYPTVEQFDRLFRVDATMWKELLARAERKGLEASKVSLAKSEEEIKTRLKAHLAQHLYGNDAYYRILFRYDTDLKRLM